MTVKKLIFRACAFYGSVIAIAMVLIAGGKIPPIAIVTIVAAAALAVMVAFLRTNFRQQRAGAPFLQRIRNSTTHGKAVWMVRCLKLLIGVMPIFLIFGVCDCVQGPLFPSLIGVGVNIGILVILVKNLLRLQHKLNLLASSGKDEDTQAYMGLCRSLTCWRPQ